MADNGALAAGIAGAVNMVSGALTSRAAVRVAKRNVDKTIKAQRAEAELAYQRQLEMFHLQNAYNSPEAQMNRFKEAGLNPHLIYGQGTAGNTAVSTPEYHAPDIQYRYAAPDIATPVQEFVPTLMAVGTWMQNMKLSEEQIKNAQASRQKVETDTERARQVVDYMRDAYPKLFQQLSDDTFYKHYYQGDAMRLNNAKLLQTLEEARQEFRHLYGEELFKSLNTTEGTTGRDAPGIGGVRRLQYLSTFAKTKLEEARASYTDIGLTDPQGLMQMVLGAVLSMTGQQLRIRQSGPKAPVKKPERPRGVKRRLMGPNHPDRRR